MEVFKGRNPQQLMPAVLDTMFAKGRREENDLVLDGPVIFSWEKPDERWIFWPGLYRSPAAELETALKSLASTEKAIEPTARALLSTGMGQRFAFSSPVMAVQFYVADGRLHAYAVTPGWNPFIGALGQLGLQTSLLQELIAQSIKKPLGSLTIVHTRVVLAEEPVYKLLQAGLGKQRITDPYAGKDVKPRKLDKDLDLASIEDRPLSHKSKWVRHVFFPLQDCHVALLKDGREAAMALTDNIKAQDWRQAMVDFVAHVQLQERGDG